MKLEERLYSDLYSGEELTAMRGMLVSEGLLDDMPLELLPVYLQARDKYISAHSKSIIIYSLCAMNELPTNINVQYEAVKRDSLIAYKLFKKLAEHNVVKENKKLNAAIAQCLSSAEYQYTDMEHLYNTIDEAKAVGF